VAVREATEVEAAATAATVATAAVMVVGLHNLGR
jgi:hypothetical protein